MKESNLSSTSSIGNKLLIGRILTRSGDQAWDFAVPVAILKLIPGELQYAALYYFLIKLGNVLFLPQITSAIDRVNRFTAAKMGIFIQLVGVLIGLISMVAILKIGFHNLNWTSFQGTGILASLILGGVLSSIGANFMDISIANDLVPSGLSEEELPKFNSRIRQIDLATELGSPILGGFLLTLELPEFKLFGFLLIAIWNFLSFFPEYWLLNLIFKSSPQLMNKNVEVSLSTKTSFFSKMARGWKTFFKDPISVMAMSFAILWISVLSPHGVLLTGFLKDGWNLPEWGIGIFRGLGGFFGLFATVLFPKICQKLGVEKGSQSFLGFQLSMVFLALICFLQDHFYFQVGFMAFILFSRVGLYGFGLGEVQIRQMRIKENVRGEFNGFATALTGVATLALYGSGALLPSTQDFKYLVVGSFITVLISFILFSYWRKLINKSPENLNAQSGPQY